MTLTDALFNTFILPILIFWRTFKLFLRTIIYLIYLASLPLRLSYNITTWPARTFINFMLRFDSLLPAIFIVALVGALTGLTFYGLNVFLARFLRLSTPIQHAGLKSQPSTPTPSSLQAPYPFAPPLSPIQLPDSSGMWSPTKTNEYKKQMRLLMAQRQDQLVAMHEAEKRRKLVNEALLRNRQDPQLHPDLYTPTQLRKPRLFVSTPSTPGRGVLPLDYDSTHVSLNNSTGSSSSMDSIGLGLGEIKSPDDVRVTPFSSATSTAGPGSGFFFNNTILEEEEDSDF